MSCRWEGILQAWQKVMAASRRFVININITYELTAYRPEYEYA